MSRARNDGGPAFPARMETYGRDGMSLRAYLAAHAPVTFEMACYAVSRSPVMIMLHNAEDRAAILAAWAQLRAEYAHAMLAELEGGE
ncbi:hypothetical protein ACVI3U_002854 [Sinorhizobium medicae]